MKNLFYTVLISVFFTSCSGNYTEKESVAKFYEAGDTITIFRPDSNRSWKIENQPKSEGRNKFYSSDSTYITAGLPSYGYVIVEKIIDK